MSGDVAIFFYLGSMGVSNAIMQFFLYLSNFSGVLPSNNSAVF